MIQCRADQCSVSPTHLTSSLEKKSSHAHNIQDMLSRIIADEDIRGILIIATFTLGWIIYQRSTLLVEFFRYLRFICNHDGHYTSAAVALKGKVIAWAVPGRPITYYLSDVASMKKMMGTLPTMDTKHLADLLHFHGWYVVLICTSGSDS